MAIKRIVAVITFDDAADDVTSLSEAATRIEVGCRKDFSLVDVTVYRNLDEAAADEADGIGDFARPAAELARDQ